MDDRYEFVPLEQHFKTIKELNKYLDWMFLSLKEKFASTGIETAIIVMPLIFDSLVLLKREYWEGEHQPFSEEDRKSKIINFFNTPEFFKMLVVPTFLDSTDNTFEFDVAVPFRNTDTDHDLEVFLKHSDYPVNEFASHCAFYVPKRPMRYDYKTKKIGYPKRHKRENTN